MRKMAVAALACALCVANANAQTDITNITDEAKLKEAMSKLVYDNNLKPSFLDLKWLSNKEDVIQYMSSKRYMLVGQTEDLSMLFFTGNLMSTEIGVINDFGKDGKLIETTVVFFNPKNLYNMYIDVYEQISNKYGPGFGKNTISSYYRSSNVLVMDEIASGKAQLHNSWMFTGTYYSIDVSVKRSDSSADSVKLFVKYTSLEKRKTELGEETDF